MKTKLLAAAALALAAISTAAAADTRDHRGFNSVAAQGRYLVEVTMGDGYSVRVDGAEADKVQTRVEGDTLQIREVNRGWFRGDRRINAIVRITMPRVEGLSSSRGVELRATNIRADELSLAVAMGSEMSISGSCRSLNVSASMGAEVNARELDCEDAQVSASMGADVDITARKSVSASASMGADIDVSGNPEQRSASASMGGDISF